MAHLVVKVANLVSQVNNNEIEDKTIHVPKTEANNPPTLNLDGVHHTIYVDNAGLGTAGTHKKLIIINITPVFKTLNIFFTNSLHIHSIYHSNMFFPPLNFRCYKILSIYLPYFLFRLLYLYFLVQ